ncbi:MAG: rod shape-determining protein RodA [Bacteroidota bacterium]|nr:rod shape-determining protein RodA [Bacteroidota bacterium]
MEEKFHIDWFTVIMYIAIVTFGAVNIYSANNTLENHFLFDFKMEYGKQIIWLIASGIIVLLVLLTDYKFFNFSAYGIYVIIIIMLLVLLATGTFNKGAQAWFKIGSFKLQPSEFAKYATALALAKFLGTFDIKFEGKRNISIALGIVFLPMLLTLAQNDTGSALVFVSFIIVLFREGLSGWWLVLGFYLVVIFVLTILYPSLYVLAVVLTIILIFIYFIKRQRQLIWLSILVFVLTSIFVLSLDYLFIKVLQPHQQQRILVTLNQDVDEYYESKASAISLFKVEKPVNQSKSTSKRDYSYNVRQSKISIGAGRWFGNGFNNGTQTKAKLVPEQHTDFIFCTIGEEYGFVGSTLFILVYLLFIGRIFFLAERQKNAFSRIFGYSTGSILLFHFFINIGMAMGLLPVIGIPLPYMSYGGSSLISFSMLLFTFLKLDANRVNELTRFY